MDGLISLNIPALAWRIGQEGYSLVKEPWAWVPELNRALGAGIFDTRMNYINYTTPGHSLDAYFKAVKIAIAAFRSGDIVVRASEHRIH